MKATKKLITLVRNIRDCYDSNLFGVYHPEQRDEILFHRLTAFVWTVRDLWEHRSELFLMNNRVGG